MKRFVLFISLILCALISVLTPFSSHAQTPSSGPIVQVTVSYIRVHSIPADVDDATIGKVERDQKLSLSGISSDKQWYAFPFQETTGWIPSLPTLTKFIQGS